MKDAFSNQEYEIVKLVKRKQTISLGDLTELIYKDSEKRPLYSSTVVSSAIGRINMKCEVCRLSFHLELSGTKGPNGKTVTYKEKP